MDNRGKIKAILETTIGLLVFLFVLVFVLIPLGMAIYHIFVPSTELGTTESFDKLTSGISLLLDSKEEKKCEIPFYVQPDFAIVGFSSKSNYAKEGGKISFKVTKPPFCGIGACICVCYGGFGGISGDDCIKSNHCYTVKDDERFKDLFLSGIPYTEKNFVLYGEKGAFNTNIGLGKLVIVKRPGGGIAVYRKKDVSESIISCGNLAPIKKPKD